MGVIEKQSIQDIADAIRDRNGLTTLYKPRQMDEAIRGLYKTEAVNHVFDDLRVNTTKEDTSFTLDDAEGEAEITELKGNTTQEGTPTPSSPVEVKTVSGDNNIVVSNKNIVANNIETQEINGLTITKNTDGSLLINGTTNATTRINLIENLYMPVGKYIWSTNATGTVSNNCYMSLLTMGTTTEISGTSLNMKSATIKTFSISTSANTYARFYVSSGITFTNFKIYPMLEKGNQATSYIEHQGNSYRVDLGGKNKLNYANTTITNNGITTTYENGIASYSGTATTTYANLTDVTSLSLAPGTYTFSREGTNNVKITLRVWSVSNVRTDYNINANSNSVTFTTTETSDRTYLFIAGITANTQYSGTVKLQLEKGSVATQFSPYTANPIELCKIGNYQDKLYYDSGKWYIEKNIQKVLFNGSETWKRTQVSASSSYAFWNQYVNLNIPVGKYGQKYCNDFEYQEKIWEQSTPNHLAENNAYTSDLSILFNVDSTIATTVTEWTTWLSNNNTTVYYVLATPTTEEITDNYLLNQLNNILDIELYEDLCYVDWVGTKEPTMKLTYYVDTDKILEKLREE